MVKPNRHSLKKIKSPLNYIGGKAKILDQILPLFPENINNIIDDLIKLKLANIQLEELDYGSSNKEIKMVLLLFNIQTIISTVEADMRFPFDKYKSQNWDIEHINSQADRTINPVDRKSWALDLVEFYTGINGYSDMLVNTLTLKHC